MEALTIGQRIPPLVRTVEQSTIDAWAEVSGDRNPLHVDPAFAEATRFGGTIAHGHISIAWLSELMFGWCGDGWLEGGELRGVRFIAPVRPGHRLSIGAVLEAVVTEDGGRKARFDVSVTTVPDGVTCVRGSALVRLPA